MLFGYLDAGSGSLILQALLGGIAGVTVAWKAWRNKLRVKRSGGTEEVARVEGVVDEAPLPTDS